MAPRMVSWRRIPLEKQGLKQGRMFCRINGVAFFFHFSSSIF